MFSLPIAFMLAVIVVGHIIETKNYSNSLHFEYILMRQWWPIKAEIAKYDFHLQLFAIC